MKSRYFTSKQTGAQAAAFLTSLGLKLDPEITLGHPALLVLDMQDYFFSEKSHAFIPSAPAILPGVTRLISAFLQAKRPVVFTRHLNTEEDAGMMSRWWRDLLKRGHPGADLVPEIAALAEDVIEKAQYDAFYQTPLLEHLQADGVTDLVITGVMTHLCCETTARSGFVNGFRVWFAVDGTATYNADFHLATLRNLAHGFATPVLINELIKAAR
jgi:isochorismate hydrolase